MAHFFRTPDRRQRFLLPVDMMEWLPEDDIIHLIVDAVGLMDLSKFEASCKVGGAGQPPFAPAMLLTVLIYAYSHGVRSSRVIERLCRRDAGYRFIVGDEMPDHTVIARFRQRHVGQMKGVFLQVLDLCREAGLIRLGLVALDGTKVKANAGLDANRTASTIAEQVGQMVGEAEEKASGQRKRGRKPKAPDPSVDPDRVANPTDPDSGIMKTRRGWMQGYNAQAAVTPEQIILAADVTCEANDVHQLSGMLDQAQANVEAVMGEDARLGAAVADAGYWSEANADSQTEACELFIATWKDRQQRAALRDAPAPRGRMPKSLTARQRMDRKLRTRRGRALYRQRGAAIEPVFGQMKDRQGASRFSMRGLERCRGEWQLDAAVHNLRKLHRDSVRRAENAGNSETAVRNAA